MTDTLDPDRWTRVTELFDEASGLEPQARAAFLADACAGDAELAREVESLLAFDHADDPALGHGIRAAVDDAAAALGDVAPAVDRIGPYLLRDEIGRGGMGTVYLAEREDDFTQRVAIKIMSGFLGPEGLRRFRAERQILASLQHPGIARLLDGGTTPEGVPYLVMEYVDGVPIDQYCDEHDLTVRERLDLFLRVCEAVSSAHRSLVVHRDLKPSNILVTADGTPKLLDFGIAKLLEDEGSAALQLTAPSMRIMTPHYASPEQIRGEPITTATDVYSLGVLLFTLLTGSRPYELESRRPEDIERIVCGQEARKPSTVIDRRSRRSRELRGDLDTIVLTALQKEPARRYASVDQFGEDLKRFLDGRPVLARPATWSYKTGRFVRRHRAGVATAAVFVVVIVASAVAVTQYARRAARERDAAERATALLVELFSRSSQGATAGSSVSTPEILARGAERVRRELGDQPDLQARVLDAIGAIYVDLGMPDKAQEVLRESLAERTSGGALDSQAAERTMFLLADALREKGQYAAAEPIARAAVNMGRRLVGPKNPQVAQALNTLAMILYARGNRDEAEPMFLEVTQIFRDTLGPEHPMVSLGLINTARSRLDRGDYASAERLARESLVIRRTFFGRAAAESAELLAEVLEKSGRPEQVEELLREALSARRSAYPDGHPTLANALERLAAVLQDEGKTAEAEPLLAEAKAVRARLAGTK